MPASITGCSMPRISVSLVFMSVSSGGGRRVPADCGAGSPGEP